MKSVGEVMAIGRTFHESLQKALRSMENGLTGLDDAPIDGLGQGDDKNILRGALANPTPDRILKVAEALRRGMPQDQVQMFCKYDPWFIARIAEIVAMEQRVIVHGLPEDADNLRALKAMGFSDARLAALATRGGRTTREADVAALRGTLDVQAVFKRIDTCAAEFASPTAYMYSTYERFDSAPACERQSVRSDKKRLSFSAAVRTGSARESSSTIAVVMQPSRFGTPAMRRSWSIATRRPCPRTTIRQTGSTSNR
jgi:carbamoyl-phosphate synthase large subunit